jgi:hypothetical protein
MFVYLVRISNHLRWDLEHDATSKQQKNTSIFIFALTCLLKMACTKMDKSDLSPFLFFVIQPLLFAFYFKCLFVPCLFSSITTCNLCFLFLDSKSDKLKVVIVYCKSLCHLNPMLFHYQSFLIALSDLSILPFLFLNFLAWVLLLLQILMLIFLMLFCIFECFVGYSSSSSIVNMGVE